MNQRHNRRRGQEQVKLLQMRGEEDSEVQPKGCIGMQCAPLQAVLIHKLLKQIMHVTKPTQPEQSIEVEVAV